MSSLVFIVDDSKTVRSSVEYTLQKAGYNVKGAQNGSEALDMLKKMESQGERPSMIITDINMPRMGGIEFLKKIKSEPKLKFIPVLVLTTESEEDMKNQGKQAGAAGWLVKPFKPEQLESVVKKFVR